MTSWTGGSSKNEKGAQIIRPECLVELRDQPLEQNYRRGRGDREEEEPAKEKSGGQWISLSISKVRKQNLTF